MHIFAISKLIWAKTNRSKSWFIYFSTFYSLALFLFITASGVLAQSVIYDNGGFATGTTAKNGVAAPGGGQWSELQNFNGDTSASNNRAGMDCAVTVTTARCADDFNVPVGQTWTISQVVVFVYQTGFLGANSPVTGATLEIWRGKPGDASSVLVFGDATTDRLAGSTNTNTFRIFNTVVPTPRFTDTDRRIWQVNINAGNTVLQAGNYWISWNTTIANNAAHFAPFVTINGARWVPGWNARQFNGTTWTNILDDGNPTEAPDFPQDFPFKLIGAVNGAPLAPQSRRLDFDGDNRTDYAIARAANSGAQTDWWILTAAGQIISLPFGLGVGFAGGDIPTPADFDGDGKTDIAVWRPAGGQAGFYIINSSDSTVRFDQFGQTGDNPTIVGDYDGDGKADPAVYRSGTNGGQSFFFYRGSANNPNGNITFTPWGIAGDKPYPGDFDGDGKFDFHVFRNENGQLIHYQLRTAQGFVGFPYGLAGDRFAPGDYDADGRTDVAAVRNSGAAYDWYVLRSSTIEVQVIRYGNPATDFITPGDYDGDNRADFAVWRSGQGMFYVMGTRSAPSQVKWGQSAGAFTPPDYPAANFSVQ
ncbi:MAG TPA: VCBS repeat-containing protein [Pyrinomonadaceae bacterium]|nr:VCBS repeat-containing protein [Pyrinomonadaceae bacterium]